MAELTDSQARALIASQAGSITRGSGISAELAPYIHVGGRDISASGVMTQFARRKSYTGPADPELTGMGGGNTYNSYDNSRGDVGATTVGPTTQNQTNNYGIDTGQTTTNKTGTLAYDPSAWLANNLISTTQQSGKGTWSYNSATQGYQAVNAAGAGISTMSKDAAISWANGGSKSPEVQQPKSFGSPTWDKLTNPANIYGGNTTLNSVTSNLQKEVARSPQVQSPTRINPFTTPVIDPFTTIYGQSKAIPTTPIKVTSPTLPNPNLSAMYNLSAIDAAAKLNNMLGKSSSGPLTFAPVTPAKTTTANTSNWFNNTFLPTAAVAEKRRSFWGF